MSLTSDKFRTPKGDTWNDADGATVTIAASDTWTADTALAWVAVNGLSDFTPGTAKVEPASSYPQKSKMRLQAAISAHATTGTNVLDIRIVDAANSDKVLASSVEGQQSVVTTTAKEFTFDVVVEIETNADLEVQAKNVTDTDNVVITVAKMALWHP
jgi:hypothetical protein